MTTLAAAQPKLLTAEDYLHIPDDGRRTELRRGVVVYMNPPGFRHRCLPIQRCAGTSKIGDAFGKRWFGRAAALKTIPTRAPRTIKLPRLVLWRVRNGRSRSPMSINCGIWISIMAGGEF